ncbi:MAG: PIN domain-containing protein [Planctomycetota bacterium]|nr:PIN domain-containing protein [Planctomycetota bacterium]
MLIFVVRVLYFFVCAGALYNFINQPTLDLPYSTAILLFVLLLFVTQIFTVIDVVIRKKRIEVISSIYFGLLVGALLNYLMLQALEPFRQQLISIKITGDEASSALDVMFIIQLLSPLILSYISISFLLQTKDDFRFVIPYVEFSRELKGGRPLVLDSSALIDGRIADVSETQIIESQLIVPSFILKEVQDIADSGDKNRRTRGRRGLDVLDKLQKSATTEVTVYRAAGIERKDLSNDQRLIELASELGGRIVTNDFNLNKVASLQGVAAINLNDVANALKPRFVPGDLLRTKIAKEGESPGQGVGFLDDGTMVVCEQAAVLIGKEIDVVVTSVLQNSAGRMIFGRQADSGDSD